MRQGAGGQAAAVDLCQLGWVVAASRKCRPALYGGPRRLLPSKSSCACPRRQPAHVSRQVPICRGGPFQLGVRWLNCPAWLPAAHFIFSVSRVQLAAFTMGTWRDISEEAEDDITYSDGSRRTCWTPEVSPPVMGFTCLSTSALGSSKKGARRAWQLRGGWATCQWHMPK